MNLRAELEQRVSAALQASGVDAPAQVAPAARPEFGDYQANGIMGAAKRAGMKPRALAEAVVSAAQLDDLASKVEIAGPGFINIHLRPDYLASMLSSEQPLVEPTSTPDRVVIDYSSVNLAKEMHVGHLRSTIIGDALALLLEALGHEVIRQNHVGDWGTQFGMLLAFLEEKGEDSEQLADLEKFYVAAKKRFDQDADFADRARSKVVLLQGGDPDSKRLWQRFIAVSIAHCNEIYQRLGVTLRDEHIMPESAYNADLSVVIEELRQQGLLSEDQGAQCVFLDAFKGRDDKPLPVIVQKSDGGYLYATTDLAALRYRVQKLGANRILVVVGAEQSLHFQQVFAVGRAAGYADDETRLEHITFGNMLGPDGKKFSTRAGGVMKLSDLLDEAEQRATGLVAEKNPDMDAAECREVARVVGLGALKYADLSKNRTSNYVFDWDQMLSFEGNTAPYLQYAYTRIRSLLRRGGIDPDKLQGQPVLTEPAEVALALRLARLQEVLEQAAADAMPSHLCTYLYELASAYMSFYEQCPVLSADAKVRDSRLLLCRRTMQTLKQGLDVLGIETIERM